jgi:glycerol-3-phosphate O-acyltransferase
MDALERALGQLVHTGVLARHEGAREPLYAIAPEATMAAAYYRNAMIHFLVAGAIGEPALLAAARGGAGAPRERLHAAALRLRDLLKFEFFFHEKVEFLEELERDLRLRLPDWEAVLAAGPRAVQERLAAVSPLLAPGTLRPFLESYLVVAEALLLADAETAANPKGLIRFCMRLAGERALQGRIGSAESAGKAYLENGLLVARARGLGGGADAASRQDFHDELAAIARDVALLAAMTENRRLGHDVAA